MTRLRLAERSTLIRLAIAGLFIVGCGMALGWRAGEAIESPQGKAASDPWSLDAAKKPDPSKDLDVLAALHPWSGAAPKRQQVAAAAPPPPTWRLAGIVKRGDENFALIQTGTASRIMFEYRKLGESLPDGTILVQIGDDSAKTQKPSSTDASSTESSPSPDATTFQLFGKKH